MRNWKHRLGKLEAQTAPTVAGMSIITSKIEGRTRAHARGEDVFQTPGEDWDVFVRRAVAILSPVGPYIQVPEKDAITATRRVIAVPNGGI